MSSAAAVSLFDGRPFFEKALAHGIQHGLIDAARLDQIAIDAPKGMVQIARYFGSEFLRPELERAKDRIVNLVSLYLEHSCDGDLHRAAESLRDHSFLSRSKGGSDMLKALIGMPQSSHFGMNEGQGFTDDHIPLLAKWTLCSISDYRAELAQRQQVGLVLDAAFWLADAMGMEPDALQEAGKDAEAVIRTALLVLATRRTELPNWVAFDAMVAALRKKPLAPTAAALPLPKNLPLEYRAVVQAVRQTVLADLPKIQDAALPTRKLFDQTPAFMGRYFWVEDGLSEVDHFDRAASALWHKLTAGHTDDGSLLTLFLCVATGTPPKTLLTVRTASAMVRKIRKLTQARLAANPKDKTGGLDSEAVLAFIAAQAPDQYQSDYTLLWQAFVEDARPTLQSDFDYQLNDALALLRLECNLSEKS
jgi:hypothetical protein